MDINFQPVAIQIIGRVVALVVLVVGIIYLRKKEPYRNFLKLSSIAIAVALCIVGVWYLAFYLVTKFSFLGNFVFYAGLTFLIIAPIIIFGFMPAYTFLKEINKQNSSTTFPQVCIQLPAITTLLTCLLLLVLFLEGIVCILMALPVMLVSAFIGACIAYVVNKKRKDKTSLNPILLIFVSTIPFVSQPIDSLMLVEQSINDISSEIIINASPAEIWPQVKAYSQLKNPKSIKRPIDLLFVLGTPAPEKAWIECDEIGCARKCIFNQKVVFNEKITNIIPEKELTFDVTTHVGKQDPFNGVDEHIMPGGLYFNSIKGQYRLEEISPGVTKLSGTSWYTMQSSMNWYFVPWSDAIIRGIHMKVFEHIKANVESKSQIN